MKLTLATNWDDKLLNNFKEIDNEFHCVNEVFGSLRSSVIGTARPASTLPNVSFDDAKKHIELAHKLGFKFNYTFNPVCTGGMEYQAEFHKRIIEYLDNVVALGCDSIVVTIPFYLEVIKNRYPDMKVKVSVMAHVDCLDKLKIWENLGADLIVLSDSINRDFELLKRLRASTNIELELLAANACLHNCAYQYYHQNLVSHMSQSDHPLKGLYVEYPVMHCTIEKYSKPENLIRSRWIRPEDLAEYEKIGFERFKIGARQSSVEWNTRAALAYASRSYDGNLTDILQGLEPISDIDKKRVEESTSEHWALFKQGIESFNGFNELLYVDNKKLDGFLEYYKTNNCLHNCGSCNYCKSVADKVISIPDRQKLDGLLEGFKFVIGGLSISEILYE